MSRFYTLDDADALVPDVAVVVERLRLQRTEVVGLRDAYRDRESSLLADVIAAGGSDTETAAAPGAETGDPDWADAELRRLRLRIRGLVDQMQADVAWLDARDIVLRDISTGLLDFPALVSGRPVWLCWRLGEEAVAAWHPHDEGFSGRRPLSDLEEPPASA